MVDRGYYRAVLTAAFGQALSAASIVAGATAGRSARVISRWRPRRARLRKQAHVLWGAECASCLPGRCRLALGLGLLLPVLIATLLVLHELQTPALHDHIPADLKGEVTLMVTVIGKDAAALATRIPQLVASLNADFGGRRYFVVDAYRTEGKVPKQLLESMQALINRGIMDSYVVVDDSREYIARHDREWGGPVWRAPRIGMSAAGVQQIIRQLVLSCCTHHAPQETLCTTSCRRSVR